MPTQKKVETVQELRDRIERCAIAIAADFRNLRVSEMVQLRHALGDANVELRVVKNRLFLRAAEEAERPAMAELVDGPTAIIFGFDDPVAPAKAATEYMRTARNAFALRKGVMAESVLSAAEIRDLATLPTRPVLAGQIAGTLQAPVARLAGLLSNLLSSPPGRLLNDSIYTFAGLLEARSKQLEGA